MIETAFYTNKIKVEYDLEDDYYYVVATEDIIAGDLLLIESIIKDANNTFTYYVQFIYNDFRQIMLHVLFETSRKK